MNADTLVKELLHQMHWWSFWGLENIPMCLCIPFSNVAWDFIYTCEIHLIRLIPSQDMIFVWFCGSPLPSLHDILWGWCKKLLNRLIGCYLISTADVVLSCNWVVVELKILKIFHFQESINVILYCLFYKSSFFGYCDF